MPEKELGLYYSGSEDSYRKIQSEITQAKITFNRPAGRDAQQWFEVIERRQQERSETEDTYEYAKIELQSERPIVIGITGDWHLGSRIDQEMLMRDVKVMAEHPLVVGNFFMGDLTDSANFNPAQDEDYLSFEEQRKMMLGIFDYIGKERILALWKGNHDHKWERKNGISKYAGLSEKYDCPLFYGNSYIDLFLNDINYRLMGSHRLRGNSIYSNPHPAVRGHREVQGLDISFCGHSHKRGITEQPIREFNGSRMGYSLVSGTYQIGTEYTKDSGYGTQSKSELGMYWIILGYDKKMIHIVDTEKMLDLTKRYLD